MFIAPWNEPLSFLLEEDPIHTMRSIVLSGPPGCGKTQRALAEFSKPLLVTQIEDLRKITSTTTHLVFDDFDCSEMKPENVIHLLDCSMTQTIPARFTDISLPRLPRIFTTNKSLVWPHDHIFPPGNNLHQQNAILRRIKTIFISGPLFVVTPARTRGKQPALTPK